MARVTVEDCVEKVPNRFDLVMFAAQRARNISAGAELSVDRDNDKNPVVALREIADETVAVVDLEESLVKGQQRVLGFEEFSEDEEELELLGSLNEMREAPNINEEIAEDVLTIETGSDQTESGDVEIEIDVEAGVEDD